MVYKLLYTLSRNVSLGRLWLDEIPVGYSYNRELKIRKRERLRVRDYSWGWVVPYKRLMGMCRWMGSHFHDWIDYKGVAFSIELLVLEWGRTFSDF